MNKIHWKDWDKDAFAFIGDRLGWDICDAAEIVACEVESADDLPGFAHPARQRFGKFLSAKSVAKKLFADATWGQEPPYNQFHATAESLYREFTHNLYCFCDPEPEPSLLNDSRGLVELQDAMDRFCSYNIMFWRWGFETKLGLRELQEALNTATDVNRHHSISYPDTKTQITLDREFWAGYVDFSDFEAA